MDERQSYEELKKTIDHHMDLYYNEDAPEISDYEYDRLMLQLKDMEDRHPEWVTPDSPTQKIGGTAKREAGIEVTHHVPMLSIQDVFTEKEVSDWVETVQRMHPDAEFCVEEKIDGLSMSLRYQNGELILAETRGDGLVGEDVTANAMVIPDVKKRIDLPGYVELRGEVYMSHEDFERFNEAQEDLGKRPAANPRNLAAGTLRQLDSSVVRERGLRMLIFNVQDAHETAAGPDGETGAGLDVPASNGQDPLADELMTSHSKAMDLLRSKGLITVDHTLCRTADEVLAAIDEIGEHRDSFSHDIDGAVVKIDQIAYRQDFPAGSKYTPGHIAYKYPPEEKEVVIDKIEVGVGRTGKMTFRAVFREPVRLCGTSVQKATLHNADYIKNLGISEGCTAICRKQGEIIPAVIRVTKPTGKVYTPPEFCPVCGSPLVREEDTSDIYCENPSCPAQLKRTLTYFAGKDAMDIKNFGPKYIEKLVDLGYLHDASDIYRLKDRRDELIDSRILGKDKNTDRILEAIEASKQNDPYCLLTGLAIRNVGRISARQIMRHYGSIWDLADASVEELMAIPDVGEITAKAIHGYFADERHIEMLRRLEEAGTRLSSGNDGVDADEEAVRPLEGLTIVVTGTLEHFDRSEINDFIEKKGGKCTGSVSKKTDYLVAGENAGSKLDKAKTLGIPVISEQELLDMAGAADSV